MALDVQSVKTHLRVELDFTGDDALIASYITSAKAHVEQHCDRKLVDGEPEEPEEMAMTPDVEHAVLMLVAHWYSNREAAVVGSTSNQVQLGFERLLWYRKRF